MWKKQRMETRFLKIISTTQSVFIYFIINSPYTLYCTAISSPFSFHLSKSMKYVIFSISVLFIFYFLFFRIRWNRIRQIKQFNTTTFYTLFFFIYIYTYEFRILLRYSVVGPRRIPSRFSYSQLSHI